MKGNLLIVGVGIIERDGRVLIGRRRGKDPAVAGLSWVFPGGG